ncbi:formate dehydrogenase accessory sulfurtransferase FdhD [Oleisolibacter albus]|uniref:formate dehydrogenase accessory sulfurtransferase FdhD n=1 Tax=Oleisolibacter albus TaxID=2171757 RepID=UPI000DF38AB4|nr:formate dehydrogenase accessory sulfurtransferase FdhD [Oleisolibacter albus]
MPPDAAVPPVEHTHSRPARGRVAAAVTEEAVWLLAEEVTVAFEYNSRSHAVMMATPADLEDFAVGFTLAEEILGDAGQIERLEVRPAGRGLVLAMEADPLNLLSGSLRRRSMEGRSGCGLCGVESLANAVRTPRPVTAGFTPSARAIKAAFAALPLHQPMNRDSRSLHAAAWCDPQGRILLAREDVGRHNALDKLAGALMRAGLPVSEGFAVLTSRCSFELVQKAAVLGMPLLATLSAPTALAHELAQVAGITLAARAGGDDIILFS